MSVLEPPSGGHRCQAPCTAATCECPPCDCSKCRRRQRKAETAVIGGFAPISADKREPVQLVLDIEEPPA